jgi:cell division cycle 20-like protein 1, cofactor of APC complex
VRSMGGHRGRVGTLAWSSHLLCSGSRDRSILHRDIRVDRDYLSKLTGHRSEVGLSVRVIYWLAVQGFCVVTVN